VVSLIPTASFAHPRPERCERKLPAVALRSQVSLSLEVCFAVVCLSRVPSSVLSAGSVLARAGAVGFCGSRLGFPGRGELAFCSLLPLVPVGVPVLVGCARGVDSAVRLACPGASVFSVVGSSRAAFALRSVRFVSSLAARSGVLVAFPGSACPVELAPSPSSSACFCGSGSGSWASVAFAVGLGVPVLVWVPRSAWLPSWGFRSLGGGWFLV
jgi:hypothetical protein